MRSIWAQPIATRPGLPHQPMCSTSFTTRAHLRSEQSAPVPPLAPPSRPTIPRRPPPPSPRRPPQHSEEDGMEGGGEAHQTLEDPPRRQRNLSRAPLHPPLQLLVLVVLVLLSSRRLISHSPFFVLLPGDGHQRQGQRGDRSHQACHSLAESRHRRGQELGNLLALYVLPQLLSLSVESVYQITVCVYIGLIPIA